MSIDLRAELKEFFEKDLGGIGRWIVIRHFTDEHDERYWKPEVREAVGGPAYKFTDTVVNCYSTPALPATSIRSEGLAKDQPALLEDSVYKFYVEYNIQVKENDEIYELDYEKAAKPTVVLTGENTTEGKVVPKERFKVRKVEKFRCDEGRVEYKLIYADKTIYR